MTTPEVAADPTLELTTAPPRRGALAFILITVALDMVALGIIAPVLAPLVVHFLGGDAARASAVIAVFGTAFALMQFVCAPALGVVSDRFGRKPTAMAFFAPVYWRKFSWTLATLGPVPSQPERSVSKTSPISSSRINGEPKTRN